MLIHKRTNFPLVSFNTASRKRETNMEIADTVSSIIAHKRSIEVWTVGPDLTVFDAIQFMSDKNIGALPVVKDEQLLGIVSERDYTRKVILKGRSSVLPGV